MASGAPARWPGGIRSNIAPGVSPETVDVEKEEEERRQREEKRKAAKFRNLTKESAEGADDSEESAEQPGEPDPLQSQLFADFVQSLEEFTPTIPDAVTSHYMTAAGFKVEDPRLLRLISLSCQKFIADVTNDAMTHCKIRTAQQFKNHKQNPKDRRYQLTMEDLLPTLKERGINVKKPHYFT